MRNLRFLSPLFRLHLQGGAEVLRRLGRVLWVLVKALPLVLYACLLARPTPYTAERRAYDQQDYQRMGVVGFLFHGWLLVAYPMLVLFYTAFVLYSLVLTGTATHPVLDGALRMIGVLVVLFHFWVHYLIKNVFLGQLALWLRELEERSST